MNVGGGTRDNKEGRGTQDKFATKAGEGQKVFELLS